MKKLKSFAGELLLQRPHNRKLPRVLPTRFTRIAINMFYTQRLHILLPTKFCSGGSDWGKDATAADVMDMIGGRIVVKDLRELCCVRGIVEDDAAAAAHTSRVTRHASRVTRHTSHVTRHASHVTHHTSQASSRT